MIYDREFIMPDGVVSKYGKLSLYIILVSVSYRAVHTVHKFFSCQCMHSWLCWKVYLTTFILLLCLFPISVINTESCPFKNQDIVTMGFDHNGGVFVIEKYGLTVTVPRGAIEEGVTVEIQAAVSLFGPFVIPKDYYLISGFVWIGVCYVFKEKVSLKIEHHAEISNEDDLADLHILEACMKHKQELYEMHKATGQYHYSVGNSFCTYSSEHFCSLCLGKTDLNIPDRIMVYHYLPNNYKSSDEIRAEVCFCYDYTICKKVITLA